MTDMIDQVLMDAYEYDDKLTIQLKTGDMVTGIITALYFQTLLDDQDLLHTVQLKLTEPENRFNGREIIFRAADIISMVLPE